MKRIIDGIRMNACAKCALVCALLLIGAGCSSLFASGGAATGTPFEKHGKLSVQGIQLVDASGKPYQLYGMSTHGIGWFPQYVNYDAFKTLRDDWNTNCIRLAMYTAGNGYCDGGDKAKLKKLVESGVDYATKLGMYVIIDWHVLLEQTPSLYKADAKSFFDEMSRLYAKQDNVIYEICNEPNMSADWDDITSYANEIIPVIRKNKPDAVILVGTPTWSQDIDQAAVAPLSFDNIMYVVHFYAATHTEWLRSRVEQALKDGAPVFISEFGMCSADGNGGNNFPQAEKWYDLIEKYNMSYLCWNLSNKNEASSVLTSSCRKTADWKESDLSESGKWILAKFKSEKNQ